MYISLAYLFWDPPRELFFLPVVHHPVTFYGLLFATGFGLGYWIIAKLFVSCVRQSLPVNSLQANSLGFSLADQLCWHVVIGTVIGARLGFVFFYGGTGYLANPLSIFKVWEGGLASHGGVLGVLIACALFVRRQRILPSLTYLRLLDLVAIPAAFSAGVCIRLGNFINQEIVGTATELPWAVIFGHPADGPPGLPLHPVQLYEAGFNLAVFVLLLLLWRWRGLTLPSGTYLGLLFTLIFGWRIFAEEFKSVQGALFFDGTLQVGQLLSLPVVLAGLLLLIRSYSQRNSARNALEGEALPPPQRSA